jgi:hypothetical protein
LFQLNGILRTRFGYVIGGAKGEKDLVGFSFGRRIALARKSYSAGEALRAWLNRPFVTPQERALNAL